MLEEYVNDLKDRLGQRRSSALELLAASGANADENRGACKAYNLAIADASELLTKYQLPEDVPAHIGKALKEKVLPSEFATRQLYGRQR